MKKLFECHIFFLYHPAEVYQCVAHTPKGGVDTNLRMVGYDYAISIEHEDSLMSQNEGLTKAVNLLKDVLITENVGEMWWI